jgi:hypothetical protein
MRSLLVVLALLVSSHAFAESPRAAFGARADLAGLWSANGGRIQMMGFSGWARYRPIVLEAAIDNVWAGTDALVTSVRAGASVPLASTRRWDVRVPLLAGYSFGLMKDNESGQYDHRAVVGTTGLDATYWTSSVGLQLTATGFVGRTFGTFSRLGTEREVREMTMGIGFAFGLAFRRG